MDVAWTLLVGVFMFYWLQSRQAFEASLDQGVPYLDQLPNFNKQVLVDGFCIAQDKAKTLFGLGTLKLCGMNRRRSFDYLLLLHLQGHIPPRKQ